MNSFKASCLNAKRVYSVNQRLCTLFQINLEIMRTMKIKNFNFGFAKDIGKFIILKENVKEVRSLLLGDIGNTVSLDPLYKSLVILLY